MNPFIELCAANAKRTHESKLRFVRQGTVQPIRRLRIGKGGKLEVVDESLSR